MLHSIKKIIPITALAISSPTTAHSNVQNVSLSTDSIKTELRLNNSTKTSKKNFTYKPEFVQNSNIELMEY